MKSFKKDFCSFVGCDEDRYKTSLNIVNNKYKSRNMNQKEFVIQNEIRMTVINKKHHIKCILCNKQYRIPSNYKKHFQKHYFALFKVLLEINKRKFHTKFSEESTKYDSWSNSEID